MTELTLISLSIVLQHQEQVQDWTHKVNKQIFELEEQYL